MKTGTPNERARDAAESEPGEEPRARKTTTTPQQETSDRLRTTPADRPKEPHDAGNTDTDNPRADADEAATESTPRAPPETTTQEEGREATKRETNPKA